jgi:hypothetical protein
MGGFKEGTVNGWDDEEDGDPEPETEVVTDEASSDGAESDSVAVDADSGVDVQTAVTNTGSSDIPWVLRRNSITDGREQTVQLHLQEETMNVQRTQKSIIESRLGESVRKADLREAALLVGLKQTDDVVEVLEEWGYALE